MIVCTINWSLGANMNATQSKRFRLGASVGATCLIAAMSLSSLVAVGAESQSAVAKHGDCAQLTALKLPEVHITEAVVAKPGAGGLNVVHCRVNGVIDRDIRFSLLLPDQWNRKFMMGGGGGFVGSVQNQAITSLNAGYATVGTDTGHQASGTEAKWALDVERQLNYGYVAVHRTAEVAKAIVRSYYGSDATRSYFGGCSNGGRQAMMEAQRYPDDFDGIVAGAPAMNFTGIGAQFIKDSQASFPDAHNVTTPMLPPETLKFVEARVLEKCDKLDGVQDGQMEDPRQCKFDIATLPACANDQPSAQCVTKAQRAALATIYSETKNKNGLIHSGQPFGGEGEGAGWQLWVAGVNAPLIAAQQAPNLRYAFGTEMFKYFVFADPSWDYSHYDLSTYQKDTARVATYLNATNTDLDAFKNKGHKLIMWHGWADGGLTPLASVKYYEDVQTRDPKLRDYFRLFMLPGVLHCAGGAGADTVDWTSAVEQWVEGGKAPERIVASKVAGGKVLQTRPLCPYPQHAVYKGNGSTDEADSFSCK
jgi:hypothetical protein